MNRNRKLELLLTARPLAFAHSVPWDGYQKHRRVANTGIVEPTTNIQD